MDVVSTILPRECFEQWGPLDEAEGATQRRPLQLATASRIEPDEVRVGIYLCGRAKGRPACNLQPAGD